VNVPRKGLSLLSFALKMCHWARIALPGFPNMRMRIAPECGSVCPNAERAIENEF
jgi:hypothetical protein